MDPENRGFKRSLIVWGVLIGAGLLFAIHAWVPDHRARAVFYAICLYEAYTLIDRWKGNTLSEALWFLSQRPLIPFLFGAAAGIAIGRGAIDPFSVSIGMLCGHFFWQAFKSAEPEPKESA